MKALLIIDMQAGFITSEKTMNCLHNINLYLTKVQKRNVYDLVIATKFVNGKNGLYKEMLNWELANKEEESLLLNNLENVHVFEKNSYGLSQEIIHFLKTNNISEVHLCGLDLDACVLAAAFNLFDNHIKPTFLINLCESSCKDGSVKLSTIKIMKRQFGKECIKICQL